jgi:hypothetical protein
MNPCRIPQPEPEEFTAVTFPIVCSCCRGKGWVFDRLRQPKDDWAAWCPKCDGYGQFTLQSLAAMMKITLASLKTIYSGDSNGARAEQVLEFLVRRGLIPTPEKKR